MVIENKDTKFVVGVTTEGNFEGCVHCHAIDKIDGQGVLTWLTADKAIEFARALLAAAGDDTELDTDDTAK